MKRSNWGFTLTELLVVVAILGILSAMLFPVLAAARSAVKRTVCIQNFHQASLATSVYTIDYDDRLIPANRNIQVQDSLHDKTWVQLSLPYVRDFAIFRCPGDDSLRPKPESTFDQDLVPGDTYSRYYSASLRSNVGYNLAYLSPMVRSAGGAYVASTRAVSEIVNTSRTLLFADSVWDVSADGTPVGGGRWVVVPPCRFFNVAGAAVDTFKPGSASDDVFIPGSGWDVAVSGFGGVWAWHQSRVTTCRVDGSVVAVPMSALMLGCDVRKHWEGSIRDSEGYIWDIN